MSNVGIPTWVFQLQPWNSEAREPTIMYIRYAYVILLLYRNYVLCSTLELGLGMFSIFCM